MTMHIIILLMELEYRKLKETYVDVFPVEDTLVNYSYNVTITLNIT